MPPNEEWKPIVGYEGLYEVSTQGNVRSWVNNAGRKRDEPRQLRPDLVRGYKRVSLSKNGKIVRRMVHELVLTTFVGPKQTNEQASHKDGNAKNCALENVCWESCAENNERKFAHGTLLVGESHGRAKLTEVSVLKIRELYATGTISLRSLAKMFSIDRGTVTQVVTRRTWTHI